MKITVATIAINAWYREIVKYSIKNKQEYCDKHAYDFYLLTEDDQLVDDRFRHPAWYKMKLIRYLIEKKEYDYILWIDADSQILRLEQKLEYFFEKYIEKTQYNQFMPIEFKNFFELDNIVLLHAIIKFKDYLKHPSNGYNFEFR